MRWQNIEKQAPIHFKFCTDEVFKALLSESFPGRGWKSAKSCMRLFVLFIYTSKQSCKI